MSGRDVFSPISNQVVNNLRLEGTFCDALIRVQDVDFKIHKVILCHCSRYFQALFKGWSTTSDGVYDILGVSPDMMHLIIDFAYTGSVAVTEENVQELLQTADQFNIMGLVGTCCSFLQERLSPETCVHIWQLADVCFLPELRHAAYSYITDHFEEVAACEALQSLSAQELADLLGRDDLNVAKERVVYEAVLRWVAHEPEQRRQHFRALFSKVRLALMPYVLDMDTNELVSCDAVCLGNVLEANKLVFAPSWFRASKPLARPRLPRHIVLATGGCNLSSPRDTIEVYDYRAGVWTLLSSGLEQPRAYHGVAYLDGSVYCVGGFHVATRAVGVSLNTTHRFDLSTRTWSEVSPMHSCRAFLSVVALNGSVYALGGSDGYVCFHTAERYTPKNNQWRLIAPMHHWRREASSTTFNNRIYVCGGFNGIVSLNTCEFYCPEDDQWTMIAAMEVPRRGVGVIAYAGRIFALGGFDGRRHLLSVETYDPCSDSWRPGPCMLRSRSSFGVFVIDEQLFVAGGFNGVQCLPHGERYDAAANTWSWVADMRVSRNALACCVVPTFPHMEGYVVPRDVLPCLLAARAAMAAPPP